MGGFGGRPHWGKRSFLGAAELAPRYPRWDDFRGSARRSSTPTAASPTRGCGAALGRRQRKVFPSPR